MRLRQWVTLCGLFLLTDACHKTSASSRAQPVGLAARLAAPLDGVVSGQLQTTSNSSEALTFMVVKYPDKGILKLLDGRAGTFTYTTQKAAPGFDSFTFVVEQGGVVSPEATIQVMISDHGVGGALTYDAVPTTCETSGQCLLDYAKTTYQPIRNVSVQLFDAGNGTLVQTVSSDNEGHYIFPQVTQLNVKVVVVAQMSQPPFQVVNNTQGHAVYALVADSMDVQVERVINLHAPSGWNGKRYSAPRSAAPFAILDVVNKAAHAFWADRPNITFAPLSINWSVDNVPEYGDKSLGQITTSHWDGAEMYLLGAADIDSDEYDTHVVAHEWGHYVETTQSRTDSPGGSHGFGDLLDMRVAFSEGWGNATSAMVLYPDVVYSDCGGPGQKYGFSFDISNSQAIDWFPGWFSEASVQGIIYAFFHDLGLGLGPLYDVMHGAHRTGDALTSLFSFVDGLKNLRPDLIDAIDHVTSLRQIDAIHDAFGTTETHDGGVVGSLPIYISTGRQSTTVKFPIAVTSGTSFNNLAANHYLTFFGDGNPVTISAISNGEVGLFLRGPDVLEFADAACSTPPHCAQSLPRIDTQAGALYVVNAARFDQTSGEITCTVSFAP